MPIPVAVLLGLGAAGLGLVLLSKKGGGGSASVDASKIANMGPNGEWVFKPEVADSIVRSLASHVVPPAGDMNSVEIAPEPSGRPVPEGQSAMTWARSVNSSRSVLASLSLATAGYQKRFLRAVPPGSEPGATGAGPGFAVLLYAGTIDRNAPPPGSPPGGGSVTPLPPSPLPGPGPGPSPDKLPGPFPEEEDPAWARQIQAKIDDLLANGRDPVYMDAVANYVERYGFQDAAVALRARAEELRAQNRPKPPPPEPEPGPDPFPFPPLPPMPPIPPIPPPTLDPLFATVSTSEPSPQGDLKIRSGPGTGYAQTAGAAKNSTVAILQWNADGNNQWARISASVRSQSYPAGTGYASRQFLQPTLAPGPVPNPPNILPLPIPTGGQQARVTTSSSDGLKIRVAPSASAPQVFGAAKNSLVDILQWDAATADGYTWALIKSTSGSGGYPGGTGFAAQNFLTPQSNVSGVGATDSRIVPGKSRGATVVSPSGMRLRDKPGKAGVTTTLIPSGDQVRLLKLVPGQKADPRSPGPGGWALVKYEKEKKTGWVQSEWLTLG